MKRIIYLLAWFCCTTLYGQVSLDSCRLWAKANYPAIRQYELIEQSADYNISNAARAWLPRVVLSGQATYQSDAANMGEVWEVMGLNSMLTAMGKEIPDLYMRQLQGKVQLDIHQTLWDGGKAAADKQIAKAEQQQQQAQADVDFYQLDNRILSVYFGVLLLHEQLSQLMTTDSLLRSNLERVRTLYSNNMALQSDVDAIEVEVLTLNQKREQLAYANKAYREMLSLLTGHDLQEATLLLPSTQHLPLLHDERPELRLLTAKSNTLAAQRRTILSASMPQFSAFAQGYYGYPNLNMFESMHSGSWGLNAIVGVRMQWNIGAFYTQKNRLNQLEIMQEQLKVQRDVFAFNQRLQMTQENAEIARLRKALENDQRIVALRASVRQAAESKYANGTITTSELLQKITDECMAQSEQTVHQIELIKAQYELSNL